MHTNRGFVIGGSWRCRGGGGDVQVHGPATGEALGTAPAASPQDARDAINADCSFVRWPAVPAWTRTGVLRRVADAMVAQAEQAVRTNAPEPLAQLLRERQFVMRFLGGMGREGGADDQNLKLGQVAVR